MDDEIDKPKVQADNQSIAIGEINITGTVTGNITIGHTIVQPADARLRHELGILLKNVQTTWIQGVLEKSVHEAALLELGLELREEAVDNPWRMVIEAPDRSRETLPRGRRIKDIFDEANRLLLILGEPGSGKTTTLLQLARDLIAEVDSAFTQPVPVILNLSTWTNKQQPLDEWLVAELNSKYRLPKKDGQRWLKERRILPLLDGLDEVKLENRAACVEKINQLVTDYGLPGLVVCSRIKDYTDLDVRLAFYRAIYIQPLTSEQVDEYLDEAGDKLSSLRATLQTDEALRSMAQSPLILNIMSLAYQSTSADALSNPALNTNQARHKHLFDTYIARMLDRKAGLRRYEDEQTNVYLSWLARNMQHHNQEVFLIEGLQPSWLLAGRWQWIYFFLSRPHVIILGILPIFELIAMVAILLAGRWSSDSFLIIMMMSVVLLLSSILFGYLIFQRDIGPFFGWKVETKFSQFIRNGWVKFFSRFAVFQSKYMAGLPKFDNDMLRTETQYWLRPTLENDIRTVEVLRLSLRNALISGPISCLIWGMLFGLIFGLILGLIYGPLLGLGAGLLSGLLCGPAFGLVSIMFVGLSRGIIEMKSKPNEGIRLSLRNAIIVGLIVCMIVGVVVALLIGLFSSLSTALYTGFIVGPLLGVLFASYYGGGASVKHYILRIILVIQGHTPANYARFLDYAVDRVFLQKVGGGYRFIHRLLLEHFAELGETKKV